MSEVKIRYEPLIHESKRRAKRQRSGYCRFCGCRLLSEKSKARGYGHRCASNISAKIILEIPAAQDSGVLENN